MKDSFHFKFIKSTWGISIELIAEESNYTSKDAIIITDRISLVPNLSFLISEDELSYLILATKQMSQKVEETLPSGKKICIIIHDIKFADTDYQPEGLYCAMVGWLAKRFGLSIPQIDIHFDKTTNKYIFSFQP